MIYFICGIVFQLFLIIVFDHIQDSFIAGVLLCIFIVILMIIKFIASKLKKRRVITGKTK